MTVLVNTANPVSFHFKKGETFYKTIQVTDTNDAPISLVGVTFSSAIKPEYNQSSVGSFTIVPIDLANGEFGIKLTASTTASFPLNTYRKSFVFDLDVTFSSGDKFTYLNGYLIVTRHV